MRLTRYALFGGAAALFIFGLTGVATANHGKVGLWDVTLTMGGAMSAMPDMSNMPPEAVARMKAMGMSMNGNTMTMKHCMTAAEVSADIPRLMSHNDRACTFSHVQQSGHGISADMTCAKEIQGTGHLQFTFDGDTHYSGEVTMSGTSHGQPFNRDQKIDAHWVSADCGGVSQ